MIKNFYAMPLFMRLLVFIGLMAPFTVLLSILAADIKTTHQTTIDLTNATNFELILILISAVPLFISSIMMLKRLLYSRLIYAIGFIIFNLSPLLLNSEVINMDSFKIGTSFMFFLFTIAVVYLYRNKEVNGYFHGITFR